MTDKQKHYCCEILQHYGLQNQLWQTIEETSELNQAIVKHHRYGTMDGILEELADVEIMIEQMKFMLRDNLEDVIKIKLERQRDRIEKEIEERRIANERHSE
jgi:NTP pyrophosphatase (non-canonical NTP hydrolase)